MPNVTAERIGGAAILRYSNPPKGTMTARGAVLLKAEFDKAATDASVRAIVITGADKDMFVRHYDVDEIVDSGEALQKAPPPNPAGSDDGGAFARLIDAIAAAPKPVIAAINGMCMGGGFELTLACDIRIADRNAGPIGLPEVRVGIFPGAGGTKRLPRLIGEAKALAFILEGAVVPAETALELGLVHALADDCVAEALAWAGRMAEKPAGGLAAAKKMVRGALDQTIAEGLAEERAAFAALIRDDAEAMAAMKRSLGRGG